MGGLYHWRRRPPTIDRHWSETSIGDERALVADLDDVRMLFGLGPPLGAAEPLERTRALLRGLAGDLTAIRWARQVHGRRCVLVSSADGALADTACVGPADALATAEPAVGLLVWSADCVPVLLAGGGAVAAVHCGWRGAAADVVGSVAEVLRVRCGVAAHRLRAALGPAISGPCYPVGAEVIDALSAAGGGPRRWLAGHHVDLRAFIAARLEALGVEPRSTEVVGPCTATSPALASYRRDGEAAGRQWSLVYRRP